MNSIFEGKPQVVDVDGVEYVRSDLLKKSKTATKVSISTNPTMYFTPSSIARMLSVDRYTINRAVKSGELKSFQIAPRKRIVHRDDFQKWFESKDTRETLIKQRIK